MQTNRELVMRLGRVALVGVAFVVFFLANLFVMGLIFAN